MKTLTLNTSSLLNAVAIANNFMAKEGDFEGTIVLAGHNGKLEVRSTNFEQTIIFKEIDFVSSDLTDNNFSAFSIDGKKLLTVLKAARDEVKIELISTEQVIVKSGRSRVKIDLFANTQSISINKEGYSLGNMSEQINAMHKVIHAADLNNPKYELNGILLQAKQGYFNVVATDARRLSIVKMVSQDNMDIIIPKKGAETIIKLFQGFDVDSKLQDNTLLSFHTDKISFSTKLINGKYPNFERIVPMGFKQTVTIPTSALKSLVNEASIFNNEIIIDINNNKIKLTDFDDNTKVEDDFTSSVNIQFGINAHAIIDFINTIKDINIQIGFNENSLPIALIASNQKEIIMPIVMHKKKEAQKAA